jgi:hypothetical protein
MGDDEHCDTAYMYINVKEACQEAFWRKPSTNINSVSKFQNF